MSAVMREEATCDVCGSPAPYSSYGRPRMYCSPKCKTKAWRIRLVLREGVKSITRPQGNLDYEDEHRVA